MCRSGTGNGRDRAPALSDQTRLKSAEPVRVVPPVPTPPAPSPPLPDSPRGDSPSPISLARSEQRNVRDLVNPHLPRGDGPARFGPPGAQLAPSARGQDAAGQGLLAGHGLRLRPRHQGAHRPRVGGPQVDHHPRLPGRDSDVGWGRTGATGALLWGAADDDPVHPVPRLACGRLGVPKDCDCGDARDDQPRHDLLHVLDKAGEVVEAIDTGWVKVSEGAREWWVELCDRLGELVK